MALPSAMAATSGEDAARQERREKKKALRKALAEAEAASSTDDAKAKRKRKRSNLPDEREELEVDITAPEPLSKREQRLAKKGKFDPKTKSTAPPKSASPQDSESGDEEEDEKADGDAGDATAKKLKKEKKEKKEKSEHGIWIGNLPWTATRETLREFLVKHAGIADSQITRVNMPAPDKAAVAKMAIKPHNKGFAYVDFDSAPALEAVIGVSETLMGGRRVLIKNANSYEGRPKQEAAGSGEGGEAKGPGMSKTQAVQAGGGKEPSKRIFVGNLTFDVTREDLVQHYSKCGEVADVFLATFQDSGKCKGYGWVTFETIDAAAAAVAGYVRLPVGGDDDDSDEEMEDAEAAEDGEEKAATKKAKKPKKMRKWFVNRLAGRDLRVEFAEDKQTRYKKRYGKEGKQNSGGDAEEANDRSERRPPRREPKKVDARNIKPGAALANAPRASGAIVEGQGTKITFD